MKTIGIKEKDREQFAKQAIELLAKYGAIKQDTRAGVFQSTYEWSMDTKYGQYIVNIDTEYEGSIGTIFGRFTADNLKPIAKATDCNPYSGKWNHHYGAISVEAAMGDLEWQLKRIIQ